MGDLNVHSRLGRPLHATVALLGVPAGMPADCFSVGTSADSIAPPLHARLSIERTDGQTRLHIRTSSAVNDPVVQLVLTSDCDVRLQREYVALLDPPAATAPEPNEDSTAPLRAAPATAAVASRPVPHPRRAHLASRASAARLVLSGKDDMSRLGDAPVALRRDTELPDGNAALGRKLAYLEAQLAALKKRNDELEAARHAAPAASIAPVVVPRAARWPLYLLALALASGLIALAARLLRRNRGASRTLPGADTRWKQTETPEKTLSEPSADWPPETPSATPRMPEIAPPPRASDTEVKEDVLDQAEVFMAFGHGDLAIHLLQEHLREAPTESPVPWLLLLDLLHREGDTAGYAAASAECRRHFNVNVTDHPVSQDNENGHGLEAYPHLLEQLVKVWNTPDIEAFFHDLIYDNRGGTRIGFEPGAYRDILLLRAIAQDTPARAA
ncbi:MAG: type IV pilus assembly protein FimV [Thiobacillus sp.]